MDFLIFKGPSWTNCGASQGQYAAQGADQAFQRMVTFQYQQFAGENQAILTDLTNNLETIFNAGPSQQGMSPQELATMNSQALNSAAAANKQVQQAIGESAATHSAVPGVESGVVQALRANSATEIENQLSNQQANITQQNYQLGRENYLNAEKGLIEAPKELEGATNQAADVVDAANKTTGDEADQITKANLTATSAWAGLAGGLLSDATSIGTAKIKAG